MNYLIIPLFLAAFIQPVQNSWTYKVITLDMKGNNLPGVDVQISIFGRQPMKQTTDKNGIARFIISPTEQTTLNVQLSDPKNVLLLYRYIVRVDSQGLSQVVKMRNSFEPGYAPPNQTPEQWRAWQAELLDINNLHRYIDNKYKSEMITNQKSNIKNKKILITDHGFDPPRFKISGFVEHAPATWVWPNDGKEHSVVMPGFFDSGIHSYPYEFTFEFTPPEFDGMGGTPYGSSGAELNYKDGVSRFTGIISISQIH